MFNALTGLGWGIVVFAITIGVGTVVLSRFGGAVATCVSTSTYNLSADSCVNNSNSSITADPANAGWVNTNYLNAQLGTTGLAGWTPAIIAFSVGMLFLGGFLVKGGQSRTY